jgi:hypothetical protein
MIIGTVEPSRKSASHRPYDALRYKRPSTHRLRMRKACLLSRRTVLEKRERQQHSNNNKERLPYSQPLSSPRPF